MTRTATAPLPVWSNLDSIRTRIAAARRLFLFIDFDGTLAPIVSVPALAELPQDLKQTLRALAAVVGVVPTIISGREIEDLQNRVGLPLIYAGNHGLEIRGAGLEYTVRAAEQLRYELLSVCNRLRARLECFTGALVECKRLTASVHVRQVDSSDIPAIAEVVQSMLQHHSAFRVSFGKAVFEIRPNVLWNKGSAARWILQQSDGEESDAICIGDDITDEDMFSQLEGSIAVRVGFDGSTSAAYRVGQPEVLPFLSFVHEAVNDSRRSRIATHSS